MHLHQLPPSLHCIIVNTNIIIIIIIIIIIALNENGNTLARITLPQNCIPQ